MTENQVYQHWCSENESTWKRDPDQVASARKIIEEAAGKEVEMISLREEEGMSAIAFALKDPVELYGAQTAELAFDGTCTC